jgi:hypothetical protein
MTDSFGASVHIDKPIGEVFDFLAKGENDVKFSPRVLEIAKANAGAPALGAIYRSTVKDAGMKSKREFERSDFERPSRIRWYERSEHAVVVPEGGYDLEPDGDGTKLTFFNELEAHGFFGKLVIGSALRSARKGADDFAARIKAAVEAA